MNLLKKIKMEKKLTIDTEEHLIPKFAIIGYKKTSSDYKHGHYFSYHNIVAEMLTAGMPLTKDTASNIFRCLEGDLIKYSFKGILPKNLLHFDFKETLSIIWIVHPKQYNLFFDTKTGIPIGLYPLPKLVFALNGNSLKVFALKRNDTLENDTKLHHAPLLNINSRGKVCMGSASIDYEGFEFYEDIMGYVEKQFFNSVFTETHHNDLVKGNIIQIMKNLNGKKRFDEILLVTNNQTLKDLYEK